MPRKKVTFVKAGKEIKEGKFKGLKRGGKSKKMSEKRAQKKQAKGQGSISKAYGSNPIEMSPYKMESAGQEKYNLMHDNPVAKHGSWMSKHSQSHFSSPLQSRGGDERSTSKSQPKKEKGFFDKVKDEVSEIVYDYKGDGNMVSRAYDRAFPAPKGGYRKIVKDGKINYDPNRL